VTDQLPSDEDLLQGRLDGTLSADESARLDVRLAQSAALRLRAGQLAALAEALSSVKTSDPVPALGPRVMSQIHPGIESVSGRRASVAARQEAGMSQAGVSKKVVWGLAAAAVVVLGVWLVKGSPDVGGPTAGTVGAAKRYAAPQISDADVKLDASLQTVQAFLDSEAFGRVMTDPEAVALLGDPAVRASIGARAASRDTTPSPIGNASIAAVIDDPSFVVLVTNAVFDASWQDAAHQVAEMNRAIEKSQVGGQSAAGLNTELGKGLGNDAAGLNTRLGKGLGNDAAGLNTELGKGLRKDAAGLNTDLGKGLRKDAAGLNTDLNAGLKQDAAALNTDLNAGLKQDVAALNISRLRSQLTAELQARLKSSLESGLKTRLNSGLNGRLGQRSSQ
jgi:hypothetical protein